MITTLLIDLDGTLIRGKTAIPGAPETIKKLRKMRKKIFFITNASMNDRNGVLKILKNVGIEAEKDEVFTSSYATAEYISQNHPNAKVYCITEGGIKKELKEKGIETVKENADVVAVGLDRKFDYEKLKTAKRAIDKGAVFVASNRDRNYPVENEFLPGAGTMVAAIKYCTKKEPVVVGKPEPFSADAIAKKYKIKKEEMMLVGDNLETEGVMAEKTGIKFAFVLGGVSKKEDMEKAREKPDFVLNSISELTNLL